MSSPATGMSRMQKVAWFHNQQGQVENIVKELKIGFGMEQRTSSDFAANALRLGLGVLANNLIQARKAFSKFR